MRNNIAHRVGCYFAMVRGMNIEVATLESTPGQASVSAIARWYVLLVMCLVYTVSIADRYVISTVLEPIRLELQLTDSGIAFLTGVSLSCFTSRSAFPCRCSRIESTGATSLQSR